MLTAINTAKLILGDPNMKKEDIWEVNVEKEDHESKK